MKPIQPPRVAPESPRYITLPAGGPHAPHVFRGPTFAGAIIVNQLLVDSRNVATQMGEVNTVGYWSALSPAAGAAIGLCWWHESLDIEAKRPPLGATPEAWLEYGEAVMDELVEQDYTLDDCVILFGVSNGLLLRTLRTLSDATERRDFSSGPEAARPDEVKPAKTVTRKATRKARAK